MSFVVCPLSPTLSPMSRGEGKHAPSPRARGEGSREGAAQERVA
jgi:hypothetical protein